MKPINCAFHPKEKIVNFCKSEGCLLPMCPDCVKVHSKEHVSENTFGEYENINDVYVEVQNNLQSVLKCLVNNNEELKQVFCEKQSRRSAIKKRMSDYRVKILGYVERYIDELESQILSTMGGQECNVEEEFNLINDKIQALSKEIEKEARLLTGEKTLKGIITHYSSDRPQYYDDRLDQIEGQIADLEGKDVAICKQFRLEQMNPVKGSLHEVYKKIFVGIIKPGNFKDRESRISRVSRADTIKSCHKRH